MKTLELAAYMRLTPLPPDIYRSISFDAGGTLLLSTGPASDGSLVLDPLGPAGERRVLSTPDCPLPIVQRFLDGRWLVYGAWDGTTVVADIYSADLDHLSRFDVGHCVNRILIDPRDRIWVAYGDENPLGILRYSDRGEIAFDLNSSFDRCVCDIYSMHMEAGSDIWFYTYPDFPLARIRDEQVSVEIEACPVTGAKHVLTGDDHLVFFGSYATAFRLHDRLDVYVHDRRCGSGETVVFLADGRPIHCTATVATHAETAAILCSEAIYLVQLSDLVAAVKD